MINKYTRINKEEYDVKRKEANRTCRKKKRHMMSWKMEEI